jgi:uncharacterized protein YpiB (UPF0302 family)
MYSPRHFPGHLTPEEYRKEMENIAKQMTLKFGQTFTADDLMKQIDLAMDAKDGLATGPEAEEALAAAV